MPPLTRPARRRARPGASCRVHPRVVSRLRQPTGRPKRTGRRSHSARRSAIVAMTSWLMTCESNTGRQDRATWPGVLSISSETDRLASMARWQQAAAVAALPAAHRPCPPSRRRRTVAHRSGSARAAVLPNKACASRSVREMDPAFPTARPAMVAAWPVAPPTDPWRGLAAGQGDTDSRPAHHTRWAPAHADVTPVFATTAATAPPTGAGSTAAAGWLRERSQ